MLQRLIDDVRAKVGNSARQTGLAAAAAIAMFIAITFFCAAAFVFVLLREGAVVACLAGGVVFLVVGLLVGGVYMYRKRQDRLRQAQAAKEAKSTASTLLSDPTALAIGLQLVRVIGVRRMIPLLAIGGIALGLLASQRDRRETTPAE